MNKYEVNLEKETIKINNEITFNELEEIYKYILKLQIDRTIDVRLNKLLNNKISIYIK